ncbi:MAG: uridine kinase [Acidobacteria bacterium]|nr:MAG: uridine kinase [Acidobacteriota bacterium]PYR52183.1 MAG: uridine kinase [Acidobacteriota bacterium]
MDRGRAAVFPLIEEVVENAKTHQILIGAGGGTRARHAYSVALDLDLPTGVLASIGCATSRQNARILQMLLAKHGGVYLNPEDFEKLPLYFRVGCIPVMVGMPPYEYWEKPSENGRIPENRTDSGVYLTGEFLGARSVIFVKDENGLYSDDPKRNKHARFIPRISAHELLAKDLNDLVIERVVLANMLKAVNVREIQIVNGLVRGNLTRALNGEHVGTVIYVA